MELCKEALESGEYMLDEILSSLYPELRVIVSEGKDKTNFIVTVRNKTVMDAEAIGNDERRSEVALKASFIKSCIQYYLKEHHGVEPMFLPIEYDLLGVRGNESLTLKYYNL